MSIETAGEQRYYDFLSDRMKKQRIMDISWISIICVGAIAFTSQAEAGIFIGIMLVILGAAIAVKNMGLKKSLTKKLDVVGDKRKFFDQLVASDTVEFKDLRLLITKDFLLKYSDDLYIYKLSDMKSVEIKYDKLFIVDNEKMRHEVAVNEKGKENSFDTACQLLAVLI